MKKTILTVAFAAVTAVLVLAATANASSAGGGATARSKLTLLAPAAPGGGWDGFARESQQALRANGIVNNARVINVPGAGGTIGLGQVAQMDGREDLLLATGAAMMGGIELSTADVSFDDVTLIARVADDYNVLVVPKDSPYETIDEFTAAWAADPGGTAIAGGSLGSIDHLLSGLLGREIGIDPAAVNYVAYAGGGEVLTSLLSNTASAGISSYNDFRDQIEAGSVRALGTSAAEPVEGIEVPTFIESGYDVEMSNWRGYAAPPGISEEARQELVDIVTEMHATPEWDDAMSRNRWSDSYATDGEFQDFIDTESLRVASIVEELGL
ncbi:tripartite tricarboxylate transporter substrate binding protein [Cryobacterium frigoriphilum]|uniref:Tripartite tricarboxylate transporter substrate binding protein n=1 Tax=Cryobacterium frigoriphilum TaxID=1259150 RepID=A0A4R9A8I4_9MICO|nr:tripartite tricarboxylate transporter substrate-binding protein [Cryobacterium frigoriphilum]TFD53957.1 tripartite tricarboxylate transporter substrate binding protein [Cryobacterium frigoriphilum]